MKTLLITGFDPFDGGTINPSWEAVKLLSDTIGNFMLCKLNIPVVYGEAAEMALQEAQRVRADAIICVGQAGGRSAVTPERIAVNIRDGRIADNAGRLCSGEKIDGNGPAAYFSTLPVEKMRDAILAQNLPAAVSNSAGTYVCNDVLYTLLHKAGIPACFVHVPYLPEQGAPSLPLEQIAAALTAAIGAL